MNRPQRNNNPVDLRFAKQTEANGKDKDDFATYPDAFSGWRSAHAQLRKYARDGLTLRKMIFKFAPPKENNTNAYVDFVVSEMHVDPDILMKDLSPLALAGVMAAYEGYYVQEG